MENKQTAVEWLASQLGEHIIWEEKIIDLVEQAKEIEKQQIMNAYSYNGWNDEDERADAEQYYNETYKSE
jgi:hypothetical protein